MKVIKQGKLPGKQIYRGTCSNCNTEVEFTEEEGKYMSCQKDGDWCEVMCPTIGCYNKIFGYKVASP